MLFCHIARAESLREICNGIAGMTGRISHLGLSSAPPKSTLAYANEHRFSSLFEKYYYSLLDHFRSTGKGAAKMHILLDTSDVMPDYVHITAGREHNLVMKRLLRVPEGTIVVFDRGYNDHRFYDDLTYRKVYFVTRIRSNTRYDVVREDQVPASIDHVILSNLLNFGPTTISNIYRARWKIEEFFRQIKQNLRISIFVGTSRNAFEIQIWTASERR